MLKNTTMLTTLVSAGALLAAAPAAGLAARGAHHGSNGTHGKAKTCTKTHAVGYQVSGTLVSFTADDAATPASEATVTLKVTSANRPAARSGEIDDQNATKQGAQVKGATYTVAAGDMCEYDSVIHGRRLRIEHEEVAAEQGRHVARAMLGADWPYSEVPYFWSDLADWATIECVGPAAAWEEEIVRGDPASGSFSIFYLDGGRVVAALTVDRADDLDAARSLIAEGAGADAVRELA